MEETIVPKKKKRAPTIPSNEGEERAEKKQKPVKVPVIDLDEELIADQEVPIKAKKKRAPRIEFNDNPIQIDEPIKKKKSRAPKPPPVEDDFPMIDEEFEAPIEPKPKLKKPKEQKSITESFDDMQSHTVDDNLTLNPENSVDYPDDSLPAAESTSGDYEKAIVDAFNNLAAGINFADYVGNDQWMIIHYPKRARQESKSRLRKILPGGGKENKPAVRPGAQKGGLLNRIRNGVNTLVRDENNLIFGEPPKYELVDGEEEEEVDTDNLHRYAQKLRELEDQDREVNPEFLVLRDGKTVYGVHEADEDGKVKLATRKPIYDRQADQKPDETSEKKKLLARLKGPFTRNKDKDDRSMRSDGATPDTNMRRKSSRKSLNEDLTLATIDDEPLQI